MNTVGQPLADVIAELNDKKLHYIIVKTSPVKKSRALDEKNLYVVRQRLCEGVYQLVVAAKMGKEVF